MREDTTTPFGAEPGFTVPALACDCHCHIFGREDAYPKISVAGYSAPVGDLDDYLTMAAALGFERRVFVQPVMYGGDSACILDALRRLGPQNSRGIGGVAEEPPDETALSEWHGLGIRGLRVNFTPYKPYEAGFAEAVWPDLARTAALVRELGWMIDVMAPNWLINELLPRLDGMQVTYTLGHFGKFPAADGMDDPAFGTLLSFLRDGNGGCWVKLCAAYQISDEPGFGDVAPIAQALYEAAPERVIWGTDWPHIRHEKHGDSVALLALFGTWFPNVSDRQRILADNPARLFGFEDAS